MERWIDKTFVFHNLCHELAKKNQHFFLFQNTNINNLHNIKDQQHNIHKVQFIFCHDIEWKNNNIK